VSSLGMQIGTLLGPALGGLLVGTAGVPWAYAVDTVGLVLATLLFVALRPYAPTDTSSPPSIAGIVEGMRYAVGRRDLLGTYLVDMAAMLLAIPVVLFPALVEDIFDRPELLGMLYSAQTLGAMVATAFSGWTSRVHHHGRAIVTAAAVYGGFIALAGVAPTIWLCALALVGAGAADMISGVFRATVWNQTIPEQLRGRLAGIEMLSYSLGPLGGQVRAGMVADLWTVRGSITSGGLACVGGVLLTAAWLRDFWVYDSRTDPYAVAERELRASRGERLDDGTP
jgi:MFS family permease